MATLVVSRLEGLGRSCVLAFARTRFYSDEAYATLDKSYTSSSGKEVKKSTFTGSFICRRENADFASMFRKSKLMQIGQMSNRIVLGTITETVGDDLYIDFGGKFHCVCPKPKVYPDPAAVIESRTGVRIQDIFKKHHHQGVKMKINLKDSEMTSTFLGSKKHLTLQEADGTLIGLHRSSKNMP